MFKLVEKFSGAFGVSGNEEEIREEIRQEIKDSVDEIKVDVLGNLIAVKRGKGKKIMVAAHMDEVGIMATYISDDGFLRFSGIGDLSLFEILGQRVRFKNGIEGIIYHEGKLENLKELELSKMYIDIGATDAEKACKLVKIGDAACFVGEAKKQGNMVFSKALENRIGCAVVTEVIKSYSHGENEIHFVFTVQGKLGFRGAGPAAYSTRPDIAITVGTAMTKDTPKCNVSGIKCGGGPAVKVKDGSIISHPDVRRLLEDSAKEMGVLYQLEVQESKKCDSGAIHITAGGIPSGAISVPCRYLNNPAGVANLLDMEGAVKILSRALLV
ncbi:MAG: M42 family metallopeptidase [Clostridium sp.]|nr:M42 family metallopeptidase [Clostridium sp.]